MSSGSKFIIAVIVVALIGVGVYYATRNTSAPAPVADNTQVEKTPAADTSDSSIDSDTAALDAQIKASANDTTSVDSGINDKSVQ